MANSNRPFGLRPVGTLNGGPWNASVRKFYCADATAIYIGDPVTLTGNAVALYPQDPVVSEVVRGAANGVFVGVVVGVEPLPNDLSLTYRKASTAMNVLVCTDPQTIYEVQGDSGTWVADNIGLNATITTTAGSTTTGQSAAVLAQASADTTATLDVQILDLKPEVGNELGAYAKFLIKLNNHQYVDGTTGIA